MCHSWSRLPYLRSDASSTLRHFLRARHSLGSHSLEYAPEWCQEPSVRRLPPNLYPTAPVLSSLDFSTGSHPTSSRDSSVHADQARFGGTARSHVDYSPACSVAIVTSDVSVAVPALTPASQPSVHWPDPPKMTSSRAAVKADAWLLPSETPSTGVDSSACFACTKWLPLRRTVSNPFERGGTPPRSPKTSFASVGSCSRFLRSARARCSREG